MGKKEGVQTQDIYFLLGLNPPLFETAMENAYRATSIVSAKEKLCSQVIIISINIS